ncbi:X-Pro dipeptidyl-peptidase protein-like protein [Thozetella sp. PMI_491]|nr:X-Pro dipeptidyl-peptidase protein-like protein [Thozetella sp. PMI_491]
MPLSIQDIYQRDDSGSYIVETNVTVPLLTSKPSTPKDPCIIRVNVYRPHGPSPCPVLVTYGPYGKDIHYGKFHPKSFSEVNPDHKSPHSAWETPDPAYWTVKGYAVVRADERGCGQSPGRLDTMSSSTTDAFFDLIEWAAVQEWSTGKVGLLGISYYAGSQWRVAARRPKGLAAIVPWEGMSDYYRDRVRHGGILSNTFISWWWNRQVVSNQYGLGGRAAREWGPDTIEGNLSDAELEASRSDQTQDTAEHKYLDEDYYVTRQFNLEDIEVPLLSVANWGGILLHLRGNIIGFMGAGSKFKYLRCITGRHDLPFYYEEEVKVQLSFLNAFLKEQDDSGWSVPGKVAPVSVCLRQGDPGYNNAEAERNAFPRRDEPEWPLRGTIYTDFHLSSSKELLRGTTSVSEGIIRYEAPSGEVAFRTLPFEDEVEITGHPMARLTVSLCRLPDESTTPSEIDLFLTIRHFDSSGKEIYYTGTTGEPIPVVKGWLRASLRAVNADSPLHKPEYLPHREYRSTDVLPVELDVPYTMDVEIWPTNVVVSPGSYLELQIASCDTAGSGLFNHTHPEDRPPAKLRGFNNIHFGEKFQNFLRLPFVPKRT